MAMPFEARYRVYWHHTDGAGIAHFSRILAIVEQAEEDFYASKGLLHVHGRLPRREVYASFLYPLRRGDEVLVRIWAGEVRRRAVRYRFEILNLTAGRKAAEGHVVAVCVDSEGGELKAVECPQEFVEAWKEA
ncbi:MAG: thioesterase family protein [Pyrobaculum sp.]